MKKRLCFIVNPGAGRRKSLNLDAQIAGHLDDRVFDYELWNTYLPGDARILAEKAVSEGFSIIAGVGGDGTMNEIVNGIAGHDILCGIIPVGSGNGLARNLGIPLEVPQAIRLINKLKTRLIDTADVNGTRFVSIAGIGFDARVANRYRKVSHRGFASYFRLVMEEFFNYRERNFRLVADGKEYNRRAMMINIANANQFGYNTYISPEARLDDGLLDLVITRKFPVTEIPRMMHLVYANKIDQSDYVEILKVKEVKILRTKGKRINLDGESVPMKKEIHIRVLPESLKVLVP